MVGVRVWADAWRCRVQRRNIYCGMPSSAASGGATVTVVPLANCKEEPPYTVQSCFVAPCPVYSWRISPHWGPCQARHSVRRPCR